MIDLKALSAPFPPEKIHWRVGSTTQDKKHGMALAYIDARDVMERLDEVCGPMNWQRRYVDAGNGRTCCEVGINIQPAMVLKNPTTGEINPFDQVPQWVWKADGAGDTDVEGDKGAFSDSFKRAAVNWGIGRYLYDLDSPWVELEQKGRTHVIKPSEMARLAKLLGGSPAPSPEPEHKSDLTPENSEKLAGTLSDALQIVLRNNPTYAELKEWGDKNGPEIKRLNKEHYDAVKGTYIKALSERKPAPEQEAA